MNLSECKDAPARKEEKPQVKLSNNMVAWWVDPSNKSQSSNSNVPVGILPNANDIHASTTEQTIHDTQVGTQPASAPTEVMTVPTISQSSLHNISIPPRIDNTLCSNDLSGLIPHSAFTNVMV